MKAYLVERRTWLVLGLAASLAVAAPACDVRTTVPDFAPPGSIVEPTTRHLLTNAVSVAAYDANTCALLADSTVWCWGNNYNGQLGDGTFSRDGYAVPVREGIDSALSGVSAVAVGFGYACALMQDTHVMCWGTNVFNELANSTVPSQDDTANGVQACSPVPVPVMSTENDPAPLVGVSTIAASGAGVCALMNDSTVRCWGGTSARGWCSWDNATWAPTPVMQNCDTGAETELTDVLDIAVGFEHSCAVMIDGTVRCWGSQTDGSLGTNDTPNDVYHTYAGWPVVELTDAVSVAVSGYTSCALTSMGGVKCWGRNRAGELGDGSYPNKALSMTPVEVSLPPGIEAVALSGNGAILVWNYETQTIITVQGGFCVVTKDGAALCWGAGTSGRLGTGNTQHSGIPVPVMREPNTPLTGVSEIAATTYHACVVMADGGVKCWGDFRYSQLGDGTPAPTYVIDDVNTFYRLTPVDVVYFDNNEL